MSNNVVLKTQYAAPVKETSRKLRIVKWQKSRIVNDDACIQTKRQHYVRIMAALYSRGRVIGVMSAVTFLELCFVFFFSAVSLNCVLFAYESFC